MCDSGVVRGYFKGLFYNEVERMKVVFFFNYILKMKECIFLGVGFFFWVKSFFFRLFLFYEIYCGVIVVIIVKNLEL